MCSGELSAKGYLLKVLAGELLQESVDLVVISLSLDRVEDVLDGSGVRGLVASEDGEKVRGDDFHFSARMKMKEDGGEEEQNQDPEFRSQVSGFGFQVLASLPVDGAVPTTQPLPSILQLFSETA